MHQQARLPGQSMGILGVLPMSLLIQAEVVCAFMIMVLQSIINEQITARQLRRM